MKIERTKNSIRNTAFGVLNRGINLLFPFVIRTMMIQKLGTEYLGLNSLFTSIIQVLNLTELGVGSALVFNMYKPVAEDDHAALSGLLGLYRAVYRWIGLIILAVGLGLMPLLPRLVDTTQLEGTGINLYGLFLIYLINTVISYCFFAYRKSLLMAHQRQDQISNIDSMVRLCMYVLQILVLVLWPNYYLYILLMPLFTVVDNVWVAVTTSRQYGRILKTPGQSPVAVRSLFSQVKYIVGHKIGAVIIQSADSIVISAFLNLAILTTYSNYFYVVSALVGIIHVGYNAILAGVGNSVITRSPAQNYRLFRELSLLVFYIVAFCSACLLALFQPFMILWMGPQYLFPMGTVVRFVVYFYTWQVRIIGLNFKDAAGMWENDCLKPYVGVVVNLVLNVVLVRWLGVNGVLWATILVMVCIYYPWETWVLHRDLFREKPGAYVRQSGLHLLLAGGCAAVTALAAEAIPLAGYPGLILKTVTAVVISGGILLAGTCRSPEFRSLWKRVKK